jgi:hypothetical protein
MRWAVSLTVWLALACPARAGSSDGRWNQWQMLMWQDRTAAQLDGLKALGFTGAKLRGTGGEIHPEEAVKLREAGLPPYIENIATDLFAAYHRYVPGKAINWLYEDARARHRADPGDASVFVRQPGLSDPAVLDGLRARLAAVVRDEAADRPLFYNLADESGIADLAAAWDFDRSAPSLQGFREWLQGQYPSLAALNAEWGTEFAAWGAVQPMLTDAAIQRTDGNFSAWSDFKAWMDVAFARAVRVGTDAVHATDPAALAALEGGQIPGWGGYDYTLLAPAVDVMEIYDTADALDLAMAFNPRLLALRTSFARGPREAHAAWRSLLHGGRGEVVWDEADDVVGADGSAGPRGVELRALSQAIAPVAALLREAQPAPDAVAVFYSQASFRVRWLLDRQAGDHDWTARDAEREYDDNAWRASRRVLLQRLSEIGVQPRMVSGATVGRGALQGVRVLLLPHAIALSDQEVLNIKAFRAGGGTVLADTEPGLFDGHGRRRATPPLPEVGHPQAVRPDGEASDAGSLAGLAKVLRDGGAAPRVALLDPVDGTALPGLEVRWFQHPRGLIMAVMARADHGGPVEVDAVLPGQRRMTELHDGGRTFAGTRARLRLDGPGPALVLLEPAG